MRFYSMKNRYLDSYNTPFPCENDKLATYTVRQFMNQHMDPSIIPWDFSLYFVGEFNSQTGVFDLLDSPVPIVEDCSVLVVKEKAEVESE